VATPRCLPQTILQDWAEQGLGQERAPYDDSHCKSMNYAPGGGGGAPVDEDCQGWAVGAHLVLALVEVDGRLDAYGGVNGSHHRGGNLRNEEAALIRHHPFQKWWEAVQGTTPSQETLSRSFHNPQYMPAGKKMECCGFDTAGHLPTPTIAMCSFPAAMPQVSRGGWWWWWSP